MFYKSPGHYIFDSYQEHFHDISYPLWLNLGYWKEATNYPEACAALATYVAEEANLQPGDVLLDAGFGFAEPAQFWSRKYGVEQIIGLNNNKFQFEIALHRIRMAGLKDRIRLILQSATYIPYPEQTFHKIIALESAFQFDTREEFFEESIRVLKPGGKLVSVDLLSLPRKDHNDQWKRLVRRHSNIPEANMCDRFAYIAKLKRMGFINIVSSSIRQYTFPGLAKLAQAIKSGDGNTQNITIYLSPDEIKRCMGVEWWETNTGLGDLVMVIAEKPKLI